LGSAFATRGVVEGFYGTPWTHAARIEAIELLAPWGMSAYAYAPKDDPKHRAAWRTPYDDEELKCFGDLATRALALGIRFGFGISPGLDIDYGSAADRALLLDKLRPLVDAGVAWTLLLVDDIPMSAGLAARQADLATWLHAALRDERGDARLTVCPTEYVGTRPSPYLTDLARGLPTDVAVMWTGPTVCSPTITVDDARAWTAAVGDRPVVVWDNVPVNDALMTASLHLGPYQGREPGLADLVDGVLCNPMTQAHASLVPLATAMAFLRDPDGYDPGDAWERAIDAVGGERAAPLAVLCRACADSPIATPDVLPLAQQVAALGGELAGPDWTAAVAGVAHELRAARALPEAFPVEGDELAAEVAPWADAAARHAAAGLAALRLLQQVRPVAAVDRADVGRAVAVDPETAMNSAFALMFSWSAARADGYVVYGPRFAMYAAVVQLRDGRPALDVGLALREDANAIDALCRLALRDYDEWRKDAGAPLTVTVDGTPCATDDDGRFAASGAEIVVRAGRRSTRTTRGAALPFRDPRLP
jgi:hyaluronoglucosaminidase